MARDVQARLLKIRRAHTDKEAQDAAYALMEILRDLQRSQAAFDDVCYRVYPRNTAVTQFMSNYRAGHYRAAN